MKIRTSFVALAAAALAGCGLGVVAGADFTPGVDYARYTAFAWDDPDDRPVGDPRLENNPFFDQRLEASVALELAEHGIRHNADGPLLVVHHHVTVRSRVDVYEADAREGYTATRRGESPQVVEFEEGTILVDIADGESREILWRGWAQFDITRALADPDVMARAIEEAVSKMFEDFPPG